MKSDIPFKKTITKICLIGDCFVGKTSIINRYIKDEFTNTQPSIGACHSKKKIQLSESEEYDIEIWDTAGQEKFKSIVPMYYKGSKGILVVFDLCNRESFEGAQKWVEELKNQNNNAILALVGNKCDMEEKRKVSQDSAKTFAKNNNMIYYEVSAKSNTNINALFNKLVELIPKNQNQNEDRRKLEDVKTVQQKGCCSN